MTQISLMQTLTHTKIPDWEVVYVLLIGFAFGRVVTYRLDEREGYLLSKSFLGLVSDPLRSSRCDCPSVVSGLHICDFALFGEVTGFGGSCGIIARLQNRPECPICLRETAALFDGATAVINKVMKNGYTLLVYVPISALLMSGAEAAGRSQFICVSDCLNCCDVALYSSTCGSKNVFESGTFMDAYGGACYVPDSDELNEELGLCDVPNLPRRWTALEIEQRRASVIGMESKNSIPPVRSRKQSVCGPIGTARGVQPMSWYDDKDLGENVPYEKNLRLLVKRVHLLLIGAEVTLARCSGTLGIIYDTKATGIEPKDADKFVQFLRKKPTVCRSNSASNTGSKGSPVSGTLSVAKKLVFWGVSALSSTILGSPSKASNAGTRFASDEAGEKFQETEKAVNAFGILQPSTIGETRENSADSVPEKTVKCAGNISSSNLNVVESPAPYSLHSTITSGGTKNEDYCYPAGWDAPRVVHPRCTGTLAALKRSGLSIALFADHNHAVALISDSLGRISVIDLETLQLIYLWKGYRAAQCALLHTKAFVFAPRRGVLEVWNLTNFTRESILKVGRTGKMIATENGPIFLRPYGQEPAFAVLRVTRHSSQNFAAFQITGDFYISKRWDSDYRFRNGIELGFSAVAPIAENMDAIKGCVLLLDPPKGLNVGIDYTIWRVGPQFLGICEVPVGAHFLYWSVTPNLEDEIDMSADDQFRVGFFFHLDQQEKILVRRWDPTSEVFAVLRDSDELERYCQGVRRGDFFGRLGPYPIERYDLWKELTRYVSKKLIKKLEPESQSIRGTVQEYNGPGEDVDVSPSILEEMVVKESPVTNDQSIKQPDELHGLDAPEKDVHRTITGNGDERAGKDVVAVTRATRVSSHGGAVVKRKDVVSSGDEDVVMLTSSADLPNRKSNLMVEKNDDVTYSYKDTIFFSDLPRRRIPPHCGGNELTRLGHDSTPELLELIENAMENDWKLLLGEFQFAYACFLLGQNYEAFDQWKKLLILLSHCDDAVTRYPELYLELIRTLHAQLSQAPHDLFADTLLEGNFLVQCLVNLFETCNGADRPKALHQRITKLNDVLKEKFGLGFQDLFFIGLDAPVVVANEAAVDIREEN